nr:unnamed protein product [Callosobruchus chinensis]
MDSDVTLRHQTASSSSAPTSPTSTKKAANGTLPTPAAPPSSDDSDLDIEDDLISTIQHKADEEEVVCGGSSNGTSAITATVCHPAIFSLDRALRGRIGAFTSRTDPVASKL